MADRLVRLSFFHQTTFPWLFRSKEGNPENRKERVRAAADARPNILS
jgi:hypothetical protein